MKAGVPEQNISMTGYCSSCDQDEFFSHRRDQGQTGRMVSFIGWKEDSSFMKVAVKLEHNKQQINEHARK